MNPRKQVPQNLTSQPMLCLRTMFSVLIRFGTELWNAPDSRLQADCGLALSGFAPKQVIARHGSRRVHDIADDLSMTVGGSSDRIEASGYRMRSPNTGDRRSSPIERTGGTDPEGPSK